MPRPIAFLPSIHPGQVPLAELAKQAAAGERPRWEHVEVARAVDAVLIDTEYLATRARPLTRLVARRVGLFPAQVVEAFLRRREFRTVCAWSDRIGLPLALLHKLARWRGDLVMVCVWLTPRKKAVFLSPLRVHTHLRAIISGVQVQLEAAGQLGVPRHKLHHVPWPVDTSFWQPQPGLESEKLIASVGWEARDYGTLLEAVEGLDVDLELAVGVTLFATEQQGRSGRGTSEPETDLLASVEPLMRRTTGYRLHEDLLPRLRAHEAAGRLRLRQQLPPRELRDLYARARFVVIPVHDVDTDCGITTLIESMAMGKAVVLTRTRGQVGVLEDGVQGIYVPPNDPGALRSAILHLLEHPEEAERMGRAGRELVERRFTFERYVERVTEIIAGEEGEETTSAPARTWPRARAQGRRPMSSATRNGGRRS